MTFDWVTFLQRRGIEFSTSGKNVARGHIVTKCPFCGYNDRGQHLEINLHGRGWRCFRLPMEHKGRSPVRVIVAMTGCTWEQARSIAGVDAVDLSNDPMAAIAAGIFGPVEPRRQARPLTMPEEFKSFGAGYPSAKIVNRYLSKRGFDTDTINELTDVYGIRYAVRGPWQGRIVFCVYHKSELVGWTGRTVYPLERPDGSDRVRYKALTSNPDNAERGLPVAPKPISNYLLWYDDLINPKSPTFNDPDTLIWCEGPFDSLKLNVLGFDHGVAATCMFTSQPSNQQIDLFRILAPRFKRRFLLLDRDTEVTSMKLSGVLSSLDVKLLELPRGTKDPGELVSIRQLSFT